MSGRTEALIVGAGFSGLIAAYRLARAGVDVQVVEARGRVGGRAWRVSVGDAEFDAGCEALDHEHVTLRKLADELGVAVWEAPPWSSDPPGGLDCTDADIFAEFEREVEALAARVDPDHPEDLEGAGELDAQTLAGWLEERQASPRVLEAVEEWIAVASSSVSTKRDVTARLRGEAGRRGRADRPHASLRRRAECARGALERAVDGRVRLEAPVVGVEDEGHEVVVRFHDGTIERAGRVVLAVPLTLQSEISFGPVAPEHRQRALAEAIYGWVVKEERSTGMRRPSPRRTSRQTVTCTARLTTRGSSSASPGPERPRGTSRSELSSARNRRPRSPSTGCARSGPAGAISSSARGSSSTGAAGSASLTAASTSPASSGRRSRATWRERPGREKTSLRRYSRRAPAEAL